MLNFDRKLRWLIAIRLLVVFSIVGSYYLYNLFDRSVPEEAVVTSPTDEETGDDAQGFEPKIQLPADESSESSQTDEAGAGDEASERLEAEASALQAERKRRRDEAAEVARPESLATAQAERPGLSNALGALLILVSLQTLLYIAFLRLLRSRPQLQAYIQFVGDLGLITLLIYKLGPSGSGFSILYLISISSAAVMLRRSAAVVIAGVAFAFYAFLLLALHSEWIHRLPFSPPPSPGWGTGLLTYNIFVHGIGFLALAFLTSYLARGVTRAEEQLREQRRDLVYLQGLYRDVIQSISSGLITTDLAGRITSLNRAGAAILSRPESEALGVHICELGLVSNEEWARHADNPKEEALRAETDLRRGTEHTFIGFSLTTLRDDAGKGRGFNLIFQDLTERRKLQEQLRIKDRMAALGEMAAGLAHEVGNPLAAISGSVQMLSSHMEGDSSQRKLLEITLKESQRLDRTVKLFLQFARPKKRQPIEFDVAALLAEDIQLLRNSDEVQGNHQILQDLKPASTRIRADPDQVGQIFWNLARNALRAMPDGGRLTISGRLNGEIYRIQFQDTGKGISDEERTKLFQPFKSFFDGGTGIGMAIVYRLVEEHGGRIDVDSEPGAGSTITLELPIGGQADELAGGESIT